MDPYRVVPKSTPKPTAARKAKPAAKPPPNMAGAKETVGPTPAPPVPVSQPLATTPKPGTPSPGWYDRLGDKGKAALWATGGVGLLGGAYGMGASSKPKGFRVTQA